jgi:hypothetical protein
MKLFFEGQSVVEQIKVAITLHDRTTKTKLTDVFLTPIEFECLKRELEVSTDGTAENVLREKLELEDLTLHILAGA